MKNDYKITDTSKFNNGSLEFITANVHLSQSRDVQVIVLYEYPSCSLKNFKQHVNTHLKPLTEHQKDLLLLGDFNFDLFSGHIDFLTFFEKCFKCKQIVTKATHNTGSQLDLIFTNIAPCATDVIEAYWSDHKMIYCAFE